MLKAPKQKMEIQQARGRREPGRKGHLRHLYENSLPLATKGVWVQGGEKSSLHHPVISWATNTRNQMVSDPLSAPERTERGARAERGWKQRRRALRAGYR